MLIETEEQYRTAIERLKKLCEEPSAENDENEFFELTAAMVAYDNRTHRASGDTNG